MNPHSIILMNPKYKQRATVNKYDLFMSKNKWYNVYTWLTFNKCRFNYCYIPCFRNISFKLSFVSLLYESKSKTFLTTLPKPSVGNFSRCFTILTTSRVEYGYYKKVIVMNYRYVVWVKMGIFSKCLIHS